MSFLSASESSKNEVSGRINGREKLLTFGIDYLDDAMAGILPNDLVLVGAGSGAGKTQLCCNIAMANIANGKRVHYVALEAELYEIERRIKYGFFAKYFFADSQRPHVTISFQNWMLGDFWESCKVYEAQAHNEFTEKFKTLFTFYKQESKFDIDDMLFHITSISEETDLIIIDHIHYFDYDDDKENSSIKAIAKTARALTLEQGKPIILISHLRKKDKFADDICPGLEEFHGSSDLYKIATKALTLAPGGANEFGGFNTYFRIVKNRFEGGVTRYLAKVIYKSKEGKYAPGYEIGNADQKRANGFVAFDKHLTPDWCERFANAGGSSGNVPQTKPIVNHAPTWSPPSSYRQGRD